MERLWVELGKSKDLKHLDFTENEKTAMVDKKFISSFISSTHSVEYLKLELENADSIKLIYNALSTNKCISTFDLDFGQKKEVAMD